MPRSLPDRPSLEHLRREARRLYKAQQQGRPDAAAVLRHLGRFAHASETDILAASVTLAEVQFALALDYGFPSWPALKTRVEGRDPHRFMHVSWFRGLTDILHRSGVPGTVIFWGESILEGPMPAGLDADAWYALRAPFIADVFDGDVARAEQALRHMDARLATYPEYREVVFWFDTCLYDQITLARHLAWFAGRPWGETRLSLVLVESEPFRGLPGLMPEQLPALLEERRMIGETELALGSAAWSAYRAADPTAVERFTGGDTSALPYLGPALRRHLERFPSVTNGLCRLEQEAMACIADGATDFPMLFEAVSVRDHPAYFSDDMLRQHLHSLTQGAHPLLRVAGDMFALTQTGREVLSGRADRIHLNGIDRWLGGVHLRGHEVEWRWDAARGRLVHRT